MKRLLIFKAVFGVFTSLLFCTCTNTNKDQNKDSDNVETKQVIKLPTENAFIKLDKYEYADNSKGDFGKSHPGRTLKIWGKTNFPDGTIIQALVYGYNKDKKEDYAPDTYETFKVLEGTFAAILLPWNTPQSIHFRVFAEDQTQDHIKAFGENGENIKKDAANVGENPTVVLFKTNEIPLNQKIIAEMK